MLLVVGSVVAVVHLEPLSIIAASGIWLYVAREGYLVLFAVAFAIVTTSASPLPVVAMPSSSERVCGADLGWGHECRLADARATALITAVGDGLGSAERVAEG